MYKKLVFLDVIICAIWMMSVMGRYGGWISLSFLLVFFTGFYRFVLAFSLWKKEIRSWLPLLIYSPFALWQVIQNGYYNFSQIGEYFFHLTHIEHNAAVHNAIETFFRLWIVALPYVYYTFLIVGKRALRTELKWSDVGGAILWNNRLAQLVSSVLIVMLFTLYSGLSMNAKICQLTCLAASPVVYWLICRYQKVFHEKTWVIVLAMGIFWYAQVWADGWRVFFLLLSMGLVAYTATVFFKKTKNVLLSLMMTLFLGILLPSLSIGYNQYACTHYARANFSYLSPFTGILYVKNEEGLLGLRDRYGLIVNPEYESISIGDKRTTSWSHQYILQKEGKSRYYDVYNNKFVQESTDRKE